MQARIEKVKLHVSSARKSITLLYALNLKKMVKILIQKRTKKRNLMEKKAKQNLKYIKLRQKV